MTASNKSSVTSWPTWDLIAAPFLDTEFDTDSLIAFSQELHARKITGFNLYMRIAFAAGGLWWNVFWGEWALLGFKQIVFGWILNTILLTSIVIGITIHWLAGLGCFVVCVFLVGMLSKGIGETAKSSDKPN